VTSSDQGGKDQLYLLVLAVHDRLDVREQSPRELRSCVETLFAQIARSAETEVMPAAPR
jgi:hypothetical protein